MSHDGRTLHAQSAPAAGLSPEELEAEIAFELPDREALSVMLPFGHVVVASAVTKGAEAVDEVADSAPVDETA